jgi:hypothetical protein
MSCSEGYAGIVKRPFASALVAVPFPIFIALANPASRAFSSILLAVTTVEPEPPIALSIESLRTLAEISFPVVLVP